jgi:hypothetical protein
MNSVYNSAAFTSAEIYDDATEGLVVPEQYDAVVRLLFESKCGRVDCGK